MLTLYRPCPSLAASCLTSILGEGHELLRAVLVPAGQGGACTGTGADTALQLAAARHKGCMLPSELPSTAAALCSCPCRYGSAPLHAACHVPPLPEMLHEKVKIREAC